MALSQEQWYKKLKQLVPSWVFQEEKFNVALFQGMAKVLEQSQIQYEDHLKQTFIDTAEEDFLDIHADERSVTRLPSDTASTYRQKIKNIINNSNCPSLKALVDTLLIRGESTFVEHHSLENFMDRGAFLNRNVISADVLYNAFTILVDFQVPEPSGFYSRESFFDREFLQGSSESLDSVFTNIVETVNRNKAFGTVYRLIERTNK
jgi:hypothetical protein